VAAVSNRHAQLPNHARGAGGQDHSRNDRHGGCNPNLLVTQISPLPADDPEGARWVDQPRREMLWAYDFNLAFDPEFNRERFFGAHVFGGMLKQWPEGFREQMEPLMKAALAEVPAIFAELPLEWLYVDGGTRVCLCNWT
jgi:hypothetical protein